MPSRKSVAQRVNGKAQVCKKAIIMQAYNATIQASVVGVSPLCRDMDEQDKPQKVSAKKDSRKKMQLDSRPQALSRSPSEDSPKSGSTEEGSLSSDCSSERGSPAWSEGTASFPAFSNEAPSSPEPMCPGVSVSTGLICAPNAPIWVDNGLKGDQAAWLLVLPKVQPSLGSRATKYMPKSPNDTVLLGPYVTTKNTFLEEDFPLGAVPSQRARAQSCGACYRT